MADKVRYTVIFNEVINVGSMSSTKTSLHRVETDLDKATLLRKHYPNTVFLFDGWPLLEGEYFNRDSFHPEIKVIDRFTPTE